MGTGLRNRPLKVRLFPATPGSTTPRATERFRASYARHLRFDSGSGLCGEPERQAGFIPRFEWVRLPSPLSIDRARTTWPWRGSHTPDEAGSTPALAISAGASSPGGEVVFTRRTSRVRLPGRLPTKKYGAVAQPGRGIRSRGGRVRVRISPAPFFPKHASMLPQSFRERRDSPRGNVPWSDRK